MNGGGGDKDAVIGGPGDTAVRARQDVGRRHALARGVEDHRDMDENERRHDRRGGTLPDIEPHVHASISLLR